MPIPLGIMAVAGAGAVPSGPPYELISTTILSGTSGSISFSSIPATYKHLQARLVLKGGASGGIKTMGYRLNSDSGNNYAAHNLSGSGSTITSGANAPTNYMRLRIATSDVANAYSTHIVDLLDYTNVNKNTTARTLGGGSRGSSSYDEVGLYSAVWLNTAAVNTLTFFDPGSDLFAAGSRFSLYGIRG
jgi:hypothetical protein